MKFVAGVVAGIALVVLMVPSAPAVVVIHPGADRLPANALRFYVDFSEPMAGGDAFAHVRLLDGSGVPVREAFRELELWSRDNTRLMVYVHPGRIKRGLLSAEILGPVLREGERFTLEVLPGMANRGGRVVKSRAAHTFEVGPADHAQPDVNRWSMGRVIEVDEWLDEAGLEDYVTVDGRVGRVEGRRLSFDVGPGEHELVVDPRLEDLAGNSFVRPFEASPDAPLRSGPVVRRFVVR